ncbi:galactose metabolism- protein [Tieghemiomyces parasiticus]|uniref:Galactose metabolism- protein n=1 Tax=Tieghemiomyces parasiticus TaxID=78921 RepID=A0A9W8AJU3_9FUNG|nr:galactose metabolism- protein [Tieghemiomyces parasiticus]
MGNSQSQAQLGTRGEESSPGATRPSSRKRNTYQSDGTQASPAPSARLDEIPGSPSPSTDLTTASIPVGNPQTTPPPTRIPVPVSDRRGATLSGSLSGSPSQRQGRAARSVSLRYKTGRNSPSLGTSAQNPGPLFACESPSQYASSMASHVDSPGRTGHPAPGDTMDLDRDSPPTAPRPIRSSRRTNAVPEFMPSTAPSTSVRGSWYSATAVPVPAHPSGVAMDQDSGASPAGSPARPPGFAPRAPRHSPHHPAGAPDSVSVTLVWHGTGQNVYVSGSFNDWKHKVRLTPSPSGNFGVTLSLTPGVHYWKFIVDEEWKCSPRYAAAPDDDGNLVNYLRIDSQGPHVSPPAAEQSQPFSPTPADQLPPATAEPQSVATSIPDVSSAISGLEELGLESALSNSPPGQYSTVVPEHLYQTQRTNSHGHAKANHPPTLPPHLSQVLLNHSQSHHNNPSQFAPPVATAPGAAGIVGGGSGAATRVSGPSDPNHVLPVPNHVVLNHLFACSIRNGVMAIASTTRYRKKYATTVYYKPFRAQ